MIPLNTDISITRIHYRPYSLRCCRWGASTTSGSDLCSIWCCRFGIVGCSSSVRGIMGVRCPPNCSHISSMAVRISLLRGRVCAEARIGRIRVWKRRWAALPPCMRLSPCRPCEGGRIKPNARIDGIPLPLSPLLPHHELCAGRSSVMVKFRFAINTALRKSSQVSNEAAYMGRRPSHYTF